MWRPVPGQTQGACQQRYQMLQSHCCSQGTARSQATATVTGHIGVRTCSTAGEAAGRVPALGALTRLQAGFTSQVQPTGETLQAGISPVSLLQSRRGSSGFTARRLARAWT